jgi:hypothetical protein
MGFAGRERRVTSQRHRSPGRDTAHGAHHSRIASPGSAVSPPNLLTLVRWMGAVVSDAFGGIGLASPQRRHPWRYRVPHLRDVDGQGLAESACGAQRDEGRPSHPRIQEDRQLRRYRRLRPVLWGARRECADAPRSGRRPAELPARCDLLEFAAWDGYAALHVQNANRACLRMERSRSTIEIAMPALSGTRSDKFRGHAPAGVAGCAHDRIAERSVRKALIDARFASRI